MRNVWVLCVCLGTAVLAAGQQPPQFRAAVDLVHLDVSVLDAQRRPVRGLTAEDFIVVEDGHPQRVETFAAVDYPDAAPVVTPWMRDIAPDTRRNDTLEDRRLFVLVLDDATAQTNMAAVRATKQAAKDFIDRLGPTDLVAVLFTLNNRHAQDYTTDRAKLHRAVDTFNLGFRDMAKAPGLPDTDEFHYVASIDTLGAIADALIALPQRRKTLVYVGQGVPVDPAGAAPVLIGNAGMQQGLLQRLSRTFRAAQRANVNIYTLDTCGLRLPPAPSPPTPTCVPGLEQDYLRGLAESTGGRAALNQNDLVPAIEQIFVENASYYLLGFQSTNTRREGKSRRIEVRVRRDDVRVRARSGYIEPSLEEDQREAQAEQSEPLRKAISGLLPKGDLPMQIWASAFPQSGIRDARIAIGLGLRPKLDARERSQIEVANVTVQAFTPDGRRRLSQDFEARLTLKSGPAGDAGFELQSSIRLAPGRYQLRVGVALRQTKVSGSIYYDIDVPDFTKGAAGISGLALHVSPAIPAASTDAVKWLVRAPTTNRVIEAKDDVVAFARVYVRRRESDGTTPWRAVILDEAGREIWDATGSLGGGEFRSGLADIEVPLPVATLQSGAYLLRLNLTGAALGQPSPEATLRFWRR